MAKHDKRVKYHSEADKPVMLSLRVPRELNARLERYASEHRQKVSELVRDAIEMRLEVEADPRSRAGETLGQIDGASLLRDVRRMVQQEFEAFCESRTALIKRIDQAQPVTDTVTDTPDQAEAAVATVPEAPRVTDTVTVTGQDLEPFDTTRYYLGKLCPHGHDFEGTGHSLLRTHNQRCRECENESRREKRQAKRQAAPAD